MRSRSTEAARITLRGACLAFGLFVLLNWLAARGDGGIDSNLWWIDLRGLPGGLRTGVLLAVAGALLVVGLGRTQRRGVRVAARLALGGAGLWALRDTAVALDLMAAGRMGSWHVPFSLGVALFFGVAWAAVGKASARNHQGAADASPALAPGTTSGQIEDSGDEGSRDEATTPRWRPRPGLIPLVAGAALALFVIPIGVMATFGKADYSRYAADRAGNLAVVFGAGVQGDGKPTLALSDRTLTAIALYHEGRASKLFLSGGPGPGAVHETEAMAALAITSGVPPEALVIDRQGLSTHATARNAAALVASGGTELPPGAHILAVTHGYHLPRVELAFQQHGLDVLTVPATETRPLYRRHYYALREVAGFWVYWGRRTAAAIT